MSAARIALGFVRRDLLAERGRGASILFQALNVGLTVAAYGFLSRFVEGRREAWAGGPGGYFPFVLIGMAANGALVEALNGLPRSFAAQEASGVLSWVLLGGIRPAAAALCSSILAGPAGGRAPRRLPGRGAGGRRLEPLPRRPGGGPPGGGDGPRGLRRPGHRGRRHRGPPGDGATRSCGPSRRPPGSWGGSSTRPRSCRRPCGPPPAPSPSPTRSRGCGPRSWTDRPLARWRPPAWRSPP